MTITDFVITYTDNKGKTHSTTVSGKPSKTQLTHKKKGAKKR